MRLHIRSNSERIWMNVEYIRDIYDYGALSNTPVNADC